MKRLLTALLFVLGLTVLFTVTVAAEDSTATFYNGDNVYVTVTATSDGTVTLPGCTAAKGFVGWAYETADDHRLLPSGTTLSITGDTTFRAVCADLRTLTGAAVSVGSPTTLRFDGALSVKDYQRLTELVGADNVSVGLLIAPTTSVYAAASDSTKFQKDCGAAGLLDRNASIAYTTAACAVFSGRTDPIPDDMLLESYSARAYLTVTTTEGEITIYADYVPEKHDRMAHFVTAMAFEDRTEKPKDDHVYTTPAVTDHYALYPTGALNELEKRLDKVISVSSAWGATPFVANEYAKSIFNYPVSTFTDYVFYTSPYCVDRVIHNGPNYYTSTEPDPTQTGYETYIIVAKEGADIHNVKLYYLGEAHRLPLAAEWKEDGIYLSVRNYAN